MNNYNENELRELARVGSLTVKSLAEKLLIVQQQLRAADAAPRPVKLGDFVRNVTAGTHFKLFEMDQVERANANPANFQRVILCEIDPKMKTEAVPETVTIGGEKYTLEDAEKESDTPEWIKHVRELFPRPSDQESLLRDVLREIVSGSTDVKMLRKLALKWLGEASK